MLKKFTALFISTVIILSTFISAIPVGATEGEPESLILGVPYTTTIGEENFHSSHKDLSYSKLTDGLKAENWGSDAAVGFYTKEKTATFSMTFELDEPIGFKQINLGIITDSVSSIAYPSKVVIERKTSAGSNWESIYNGTANELEGTRTETVLASDSTIYAYALRVTLTGKARFVWTFLDEIEVFAETSGEAYGALSVSQKVISPRITKDLDEYKYLEAGDSYTMKVKGVSPEGGEISYQWYNGNTPIGEDSPEFTIENATLEDAGSYRVEVINTVNGYTASEFSKTCTLLVGDADSEANAPIIDMDIPSNYSVIAGNKLTFEMAAQSVDGGVISYQWYKDGVKIEGATGAKLVLDPAKVSDAGVYEAKVINTKNGTTASVFSNDCILTVGKEPINLIAGKTYTHTVVPIDGVNDVNGFHKNGTDDNCTKLTDGVTTSSWGGGQAFGVYVKGDNTTFEIDFALEDAINFQQINIGTIGNTSGIMHPYNVKVQVKNEDNPEWTQIYDGKPTTDELRYEFMLGSDTAIEATDVRFVFTGSGSWLFIDEIYIYDVSTGEKLAGTLTPPPVTDDGGDDEDSEEPEEPSGPDGNNIALGKSYTPIQTDSERLKKGLPIIPDDYPDTDGKELTDGLFADPGNTKDDRWVGFNNGGMYKKAVVVFDLEKVESFKEVKVNFLTVAASGIGVPNKIKIETSNDGSNWTSMARDDLGYSVIIDLGEEQEFQRVTAGFLKATGSTPMGVYEHICAVPDAVNARYVRLSWEFIASWAFVDEVQINKEITERPKNTPEAVVDRIPNPDPENIAFGMPYTVNADFSQFYPDSGIKLTDGRHGTASGDSIEWVAYNAPEGSGGYMSNDKASSKYPTGVKVEYSSDGNKWKFFTESDLAELQSAPVGTRRFDYGQLFTSKARYIKVTVYGTDFVALDEIEVFKSFDGTLDYELTDDAKLSYNLSANYPSASSRNADAGDAETMLTDGIYGEWIKYDHKGNTKDDHIMLDFDITDLNSIEKLVFHTRSGSGTPKNVLFKVSTDGNNWVTIKNFFAYSEADEDGRGVSFIWDGDKDPFYMFADSADSIYARFVRVEFDVPAGKTVSVDEMSIMGKRGRTSTAAVAINKPGEEHNLALGKPYERVPGLSTPAYPDTNNSELTDGIHGTTNYMDPAWVGHNYREYGPTGETKYRELLKSYIVDLGELKTITSVKATFLGSPGAGFNTPAYIDTLVSVDGYNWMKLTNNDTASKWPSGVQEYGWHANGTDGLDRDMTDGAQMVVARYVRVAWQLITTTMIDEIEVYGYDEIKSGEGIMSAEEVASRATPHDNGGDYLTPEETGGIHDLLLCYNGWYGTAENGTLRRGEWNAHRFKPMLTYIDENGDSVDTMFDAVLFLALNARSGRGHGWRTSWIAEDIVYWYDQMFKEGGDIDELNKAALQVREDLNLPDYKVKLVISFPQVWHEGSSKPKYFGWLGDREIVDIGEIDNFTYYTNWWIDKVQEGLEKGNWEAVEFTGYYWTHEGISATANNNDPNDGKLTGDVNYNSESIQHTAELINDAEKRWNKEFLFYWIPYSSAEGIFHARKNNIDVWSTQTGNYFVREMSDGADYGGMGNPGICTTVASSMSYIHASMEFEFDGGVANNPLKYNAFLDYINAAVQYDMTGRDVYRSWYQGIDDLYAIAYNRKQVVRDLYTAIYKLIDGTLTEEIPHIKEISDVQIEGDLGAPYASGDAAGGAPGGTAGGSGGGGGGYYYEEPAEETVVETATPSDEGYVWFTGTNGYQLKDKEGNFVKGWAQVNGDWYYLSADGYLTTGWVKDQNTWYYLKANGVMADDGWYKVDNVWYYFGSTGAMKTGWVLDNGRWYYMLSSGAMAKSTWVEVNGNWYYFTQGGAMATGWVLDGNNWYYLNESGAMATGWKVVKGEWYYLDPANGKMLSNTTVDGYKLGTDGKWIA